MNDIQKKTYIDKDETDSMEKKQMKKTKQIVCTYNNESGGGGLANLYLYLDLPVLK